jgi:opacity protein-like surface antigen
MKRFVAGVALFLAVSPAAWADVGVLLKAGTLGAGLDVSKGISEKLAVRLQANALNHGYDFTESDVEYKAELELRSAGVLLDWHPFSGVFRVSGGAYWNGNKATATARPTGGTYEINGQTYNSTDIGSLNGKIDFPSVAPYLGIGFGSAPKAGRGMTFSFDLGMLYQREPNVGLTVVCGAALTAPQCTQLRNDVAAEAVSLQDELKDFKFYPVVSFGIGYRF